RKDRQGSKEERSAEPAWRTSAREDPACADRAESTATQVQRAADCRHCLWRCGRQDRTRSASPCPRIAAGRIRIHCHADTHKVLARRLSQPPPQESAESLPFLQSDAATPPSSARFLPERSREPSAEVWDIRHWQRS